ncbi:hypothetical protein ABZ897_53200 [Nonomuraea sp. NPDC046802]|uniref:hypothetical protein n=1 Tax=Nonomuraea sp. NPDC046802 TaxID=3154919 RepID=UPI003405E5D2
MTFGTVAPKSALRPDALGVTGGGHDAVMRFWLSWRRWWLSAVGVAPARAVGRLAVPAPEWWGAVLSHVGGGAARNGRAVVAWRAATGGVERIPPWR